LLTVCSYVKGTRMSDQLD